MKLRLSIMTGTDPTFLKLSTSSRFKRPGLHDFSFEIAVLSNRLADESMDFCPCRCATLTLFKTVPPTSTRNKSDALILFSIVLLIDVWASAVDDLARVLWAPN